VVLQFEIPDCRSLLGPAGEYCRQHLSRAQETAVFALAPHVVRAENEREPPRTLFVTQPFLGGRPVSELPAIQELRGIGLSRGVKRDPSRCAQQTSARDVFRKGGTARHEPASKQHAQRLLRYALGLGYRKLDVEQPPWQLCGNN
jgi:hypothetical protein